MNKIKFIILAAALLASVDSYAEVGAYVPGVSSGGVMEGLFSGLPADGSQGSLYVVTDCTDAACATGTGTPGLQVTKEWDGSAWSNVATGSGIGSVSEDILPVLGGPLDANGKNVTGAGVISGERLGSVYYVDEYPGADMWEKLNAAYADSRADPTHGDRAAIFELPRGNYTVTSDTADFCNESGRAANTGGIIRGQGASISGATGTQIIAGAGFESANVTRTNYTITAGGGDGGRDIIECSGCNFRSEGIRRGSLIETTGFASAGNNYSKTVGSLPLKVYRAEDTRLTVEDERTINATLVNVTSTTTGEVRLLKPMIETCSGTWVIRDLTLNPDEVADIAIHHRPDNSSNTECTAVDTPYDGVSAGEEGTDCTGAGTGTGSPLISVGGGVRNVWVYDPVYFGVAVTALEAAGQADHYTIEEGSHFWGGLVSVWYDGLQSQPGLIVRDSQLEHFQRAGYWLSSGTGILDNATVVSANSDCVADTYGQSAHIWMSYENVVGLKLMGKTNIETKCGEGIHVVNGGSLSYTIRSFDLSGAYIQANSTDVATLVSADSACLDIVLTGTRFVDNTGPTGAASEINFGNPNQATCPSKITGTPSFADQGTVGFVPVMTVTDNIPQSVLMVGSGDDGDGVKFDANGNLISTGLPGSGSWLPLTGGTISGAIADNDDFVIDLDNDQGSSPNTSTFQVRNGSDTAVLLIGEGGVIVTTDGAGHYSSFYPNELGVFTYKLPEVEGTAGQQLTWNTGGDLSWETAGGGSSIFSTQGLYEQTQNDLIVGGDGDGTAEATEVEILNGVVTADGFVARATANPLTQYKDSDATAGDVNVQFSIDCSDPANTAEDCDIAFSQQEAGTLRQFMNADADDELEIGGSGQNRVVVTTDSTGDSELVLPGLSVGSGEIAAAAVTGSKLGYSQMESVTIEDPVDADNFMLFKAPQNITVTGVDCITVGGTSAIIDVQERTSAGATPATVDATITCDSDGAADDGAFSNGGIDANDWVSLDIGTVTGSVTQVSVTITYTVD